MASTQDFLEFTQAINGMHEALARRLIVHLLRNKIHITSPSKHLAFHMWLG